MKYEEPSVRFFRKVGPPTERGCRQWQGSLNDDGYGQFWDGTRMTKAHRWVFIWANGPLTPERPIVMHSCDTPSCVEPSHLLAGTDLENAQHKYAVGRSRHAAREANGNARLTEAVVAEIRSLHQRFGLSHVALGRRFGIAQSHAGRIVRQENWK